MRRVSRGLVDDLRARLGVARGGRAEEIFTSLDTVRRIAERGGG